MTNPWGNFENSNWSNVNGTWGTVDQKGPDPSVNFETDFAFISPNQLVVDYTPYDVPVDAHYDEFVSWLPKSFLSDNSVTFRAFLKAFGRQCDDLESSILDTQNQLFAQQATWALSNYETEYGIKLVDGSTDQQRQSNVTAKMRTGQGATPNAVLNVLAAYGYNVQIIEDFPNYQFTIKFTDFKGIPSNMGDLKLLLQSMIPAHLKTNYQYLYNVYSDFDGNYTYDQIKASGKTYDELQTQLP